VPGSECSTGGLVQATRLVGSRRAGSPVDATSRRAGRLSLPESRWRGNQPLEGSGRHQRRLRGLATKVRMTGGSDRSRAGLASRCLRDEVGCVLGREQGDRKTRARTLTLIPYVAGGVTYLLAGLLNPHGWQLVLVSAAAASLGGTSLLAWYPPLWAARPAGEQTSPALGISPSAAWWVVAALVLAVYVAVLGPGVRFATR